MVILNLTQHIATTEQISAGVRDLPPEVRKQLSELLTFDVLPSHEEIVGRAIRIAELADMAAQALEAGEAMIGGAPYLMAPLEGALHYRGIASVYAFSVRTSAEVVQPDGTVRKVAEFRHVGFVPACGS